jgi:hypothetical protein
MKMITQYCNNCGKYTGHKRVIGIGTFFAAVLTLGAWIFVTPLYPKRCIVCGLTKNLGGHPPESAFSKPSTYLIIFIGWILFMMFLAK